MTDTEKRELQMTFPGYDLVLSLRGHSAIKNDIFDAAADEIERLREALVPFAEAADALDKENWDDDNIEGSCADINAKDCRAARDVLDKVLK